MHPVKVIFTSDDLDINGNIRPSGVSSHTKADETTNTSETDQVEAM